MSQPQSPEYVKLISSVLSNNMKELQATVVALVEKFGSVDYISSILPFDYTKYYEREMGSSLLRRFISFETLIKPETLPDIKLTTNTIEESFSKEGKRNVNIDPGYLSPAHLILATGKGFTHRPYLRDGIYADLTLIYSHNTFEPLQWTYPDYGGEKIRKMLQVIRKKYLMQLKQLKTDTPELT
jgi:hypothetical protein